nr:THAP domain-containing protein 4-like isoform X2 [Halyomorpha halys]
MVTCSVLRCTNRTGRNKVTFHRIPVDPELRTQWIKAINRKNWTPAPNSRICSDHFVPSDFNMTYHSQIAHLREGVIPSIFPPLPKHLRIIPDLRIHYLVKYLLKRRRKIMMKRVPCLVK